MPVSERKRSTKRVMLDWPKWVKDKSGNDTEVRYRGKTVQAEKENCDINVMMERFAEAGALPPRDKQSFLDVSNVPSYQDALDRVIHAQEQFDAMPAKVRRFFDNSPAKFVQQVGDPAWRADPRNARALVAMGLATERVAVTPSPAAPAGGQPAPGAANKVLPKKAKKTSQEGDDE